MKENKKLSIQAIKKVNIAEVGIEGVTKQFLIKRKFEDYAIVVKDEVRYTIYKIATCDNSFFDYGIVAKCLINNTVNYLIVELTNKQIEDALSGWEVNKNTLDKFLNNLIDSKQLNRDKFAQYLRDNFQLEINN